MEKGPVLAVDGVIVEGERVVLIERRDGMGTALPGGGVKYGENVEEALMREVREETGLEVEVQDLLGVYSDPERDPRHHIVTVVFVCRPTGGELEADDDAEEVGWFGLEEAREMELAFDHAKIISDFLRRRSRRAEESG